MQCQTCTTPTKYIMGLWDDASGTHGKIFSCHNLECELKINRLRNDIILEEEKKTVTIINEANMIFVQKIKAKRKELQITIRAMADELGISPSDYSNYEMCRVALPVELVERIDGAFRKELKNNV